MHKPWHFRVVHLSIYTKYHLKANSSILIPVIGLIKVKFEDDDLDLFLKVTKIDNMKT